MASYNGTSQHILIGGFFKELAHDTERPRLGERIGCGLLRVGPLTKACQLY
jgi:hypothetical protein